MNKLILLILVLVLGCSKKEDPCKGARPTDYGCCSRMAVIDGTCGITRRGE